MKKLILTLLLTLSMELFAQNDWPAIGTQWYYSYREGMLPQWGYVLLEVTGDTTIAGVQCKTLEERWYSPKGDIINGGKKYIYYKNERVYHFQRDSFYLLYDFTLSVGDTFRIKLFNEERDTTLAIVIDTISTITVGDSSFKTYYYRPAVQNHGECWQIEGTVIERIGHLKYFFPVYYCPFWDLNDVGPLRCYQDSVFFYKARSEACDTLIQYTGIKDVGNKMELYPNPSVDFVQLRFDKPINTRIKIRVYNLSGQIIPIKYSFTGDNTIILDIRNLISNIYCLQVIHNSEIIHKPFFKSE
jgi:hypothetical protein